MTAEESEESSGLGLPNLNIVFEREAVLISLTGGEGGTASFGAKKVEITEDMPRAEIKNRLKQLIYVTLAEHTGGRLPWGTLTGIRPTKNSPSRSEAARASSTRSYRYRSLSIRCRFRPFTAGFQHPGAGLPQSQPRYVVQRRQQRVQPFVVDL